ncbi:phosphate acyltransferase PlsX [Spiroplasma chrysopicola]|uniref:Phosphate acyltransferase n=1 Tax=Spiroplasma chrysopicola DF-1 TaxID=1276227 RepID=R4U231_9MOLU|nr:phosphate acyltransferase PlsX [Spiroplasma chrysopicola]AGM25402.1 glycerol-3-phosphate acyltransferase PlsX [Spiroplasma chrysopicola DF-1]
MHKIAIDMMGTDLGIPPIVDALKVFVKKYSDVFFVLVGDKAVIKEGLHNKKINPSRYEIFHTSEVIAMTEGMMEVRRKPDSSMVRSAELLANDKVEAFVSGGSTAAYLSACHFIIGELEGINRPAFMPFIPTIKKGKSVMMLDVGANLENNARDLVNFALMATVYAKVIMNLNSPTVGLLNIGHEESKGKDYHKEAYKMLQVNNNINFYGNIEPRDITSNIVDIIVTDGFTGNVALKTLEGMAKNLMAVLKQELTKNIFRKLKALSLRKAFRGVRETFDYRNNASALMLGLKKVAVKTHGSSDAKSWISTLEMTRKAIINDFVKKIEAEIKKGV